MKKLLLLLMVSFVFLTAWEKNECEHIYVAVEQVKINASNYTTSALTATYRYGEVSGKEIVCVKCFDKTHQIMDYGEANPTLNSILDKMYKHGTEHRGGVIQTEGILLTDTVRK